MVLRCCLDTSPGSSPCVCVLWLQNTTFCKPCQVQVCSSLGWLAGLPSQSQVWIHALPARTSNQKRRKRNATQRQANKHLRHHTHDNTRDNTHETTAWRAHHLWCLAPFDLPRLRLPLCVDRFPPADLRIFTPTGCITMDLASTTPLALARPVALLVDPFRSRPFRLRLPRRWCRGLDVFPASATNPSCLRTCMP